MGVLRRTLLLDSKGISGLDVELRRIFVLFCSSAKEAEAAARAG